MAFNPFDVFRRNQRILFAILTVFIMLMFTLSFGQGDFFQSIPRWLGNKRQTGELLAVMDGSKIYESDLRRANERRVIANQYMSAAARSSIANLDKYVKESTTRVSPEHRQTISTASRIAGVLPLVLQSGRESPEIMSQIRETLQRLQLIANAKNAKKEDTEVAQAAQYLINLVVDVVLAPPGHYFTNQPNATNQDKIDYLIWLKKAEKLGVVFTDRDVDDLVAHEFHRRLNADDLSKVIAEMQSKPGFTYDGLKSALADEFRVRAAQSAVMGQGFSRSADGVRVFEAPYDYFRFYQEQASPARFGVVSVPVDNYLDQVTGQPTERELRDIFAKSKNVEPSPTNPVPGLKEPRRLKLGWIEVTGNEPYYKSAAADSLKKLTAASRINGFLIAPLLGPVNLTHVAGVAPLATGDPVLHGAYERYKGQAKSAIESNLFDRMGRFSLPPALSEPSYVKPQPLAAMAASAFGSQLTGAPILTSPLVFEQTAAVFDRQERAKALATTLAPSIFFFERVGNLGAVGARLPGPLPLAVVRPQLEEEVAKGLARNVTIADLKKFSEEVAKIGDKPEKAPEVKAYVDKFVKERGLKMGGSEKFEDQYSMGDDPGLAPVKAMMPAPHGSLRQPLQFGRKFFFTIDPARRQEVPTTTLFQPESYPEGELANWMAINPIFMVWRSAEQPAETPRNLDAPGVKAKAEAAWRKLKARELAKKAAEELAKKAETLGNEPVVIGQKLRDLEIQFMNSFPKPEQKFRVRTFSLDNVAALVTTNDFEAMLRAGGRQQVGPYQVPATSNIPYPTAKMGEELIKAKSQPLSSAVVLSDAGEENFYVAVLEGRFDRSAEEFGFTVFPSPPAGELAGAVFAKFQGEARKQTRTTALDLLKAEFHYEKKSDKVDAKSEGSYFD